MMAPPAAYLAAGLHHVAEFAATFDIFQPPAEQRGPVGDRILSLRVLVPS